MRLSRALSPVLAATLCAVTLAGCGGSGESGGSSGSGGGDDLPDPLAVAAKKAKLPSVEDLEGLRENPKGIAMWFAVAKLDCSPEGEKILRALSEPGYDPHSNDQDGYDLTICKQSRSETGKRYTGLVASDEQSSEDDPTELKYDFSFEDRPPDDAYFVTVRQIPSTGKYVVNGNYM